jgi:hypothetical protein
MNYILFDEKNIKYKLPINKIIELIKKNPYINYYKLIDNNKILINNNIVCNTQIICHRINKIEELVEID